MSITIKDVAKEVGVAPSTVSRTLKDHPSISEETKEKVRKAMKKLGYVPNVSARNLASNLSHAIGVVLPVIDSKERGSNPFYLEVMTAMNEEAGRHQVTLSLASGENEDELLENVELMYRQKRVDGFVLLYGREDDRVLDFLVAHQVPFTIIGQPYRYHNEANCVDNDNQLLGRTATQYLIDKGHREIVFVSNNVKETFFKERFYGYQSCLDLHGLQAYPVYSLNEFNDYLSFESLLQERKVTACIALDDMFALKLIQFLQLSGIKVPDDMSVISFNHSIFTTLIHPYITSIDVNAEELGKVAVSEFLAQLKDPTALKKRVIIPHELMEYETVIHKK